MSFGSKSSTLSTKNLRDVVGKTMLAIGETSLWPAKCHFLFLKRYGILGFIIPVLLVMLTVESSPNVALVSDEIDSIEILTVDPLSRVMKISSSGDSWERKLVAVPVNIFDPRATVMVPVNGYPSRVLSIPTHLNLLHFSVNSTLRCSN
jgi:hypothetical protein